MHECGYHETHEFAKELVITVQARAFFGEAPFEEETTGSACRLR